MFLNVWNQKIQFNYIIYFTKQFSENNKKNVPIYIS